MILALHGFLGQPSDWDPFRRDWKYQGSGEIFTPSLFSPAAVKGWGPEVGSGMKEWAARFAQDLDRQRGGQMVNLIGYSMGGRLALHLLMERPDIFDRVVIVSAGMGIPAEEKPARMEADERWARRFESDSKWDALIKDWNAQPVLRGEEPLQRLEKDYDRKALATALREWSIAKQELGRDELKKIQTPVLWLAGGEDATYVRHGEEAARLISSVLFRKIDGVGHRVPWEAPQLFGQDVKSFLQA